MVVVVVVMVVVEVMEIVVEVMEVVAVGMDHLTKNSRPRSSAMMNTLQTLEYSGWSCISIRRRLAKSRHVLVPQEKITPRTRRLTPEKTKM